MTFLILLLWQAVDYIHVLLIMHQCRNLEDSEKDYLRGQLLQLVLEEDSQVSVVHMC